MTNSILFWANIKKYILHILFDFMTEQEQPNNSPTILLSDFQTTVSPINHQTVFNRLFDRRFKRSSST